MKDWSFSSLSHSIQVRFLAKEFTRFRSFVNINSISLEFLECSSQRSLLDVLDLCQAQKTLEHLEIHGITSSMISVFVTGCRVLKSIRIVSADLQNSLPIIYQAKSTLRDLSLCVVSDIPSSKLQSGFRTLKRLHLQNCSGIGTKQILPLIQDAPLRTLILQEIEVVQGILPFCLRVENVWISTRRQVCLTELDFLIRQSDSLRYLWIEGALLLSISQLENIVNQSTSIVKLCLKDILDFRKIAVSSHPKICMPCNCTFREPQSFWKL